MPLEVILVPDKRHEWLFDKEQTERLEQWLTQLSVGKLPGSASETPPSQSSSDAPSSQPTTPADVSVTQPAKELAIDLGNNVSMKLALIPAGKFMMGSPKDEEAREGYGMRLMLLGPVDNESPRHEVTISKPFYMGAYLVTQEQYEQVMGKNPSESNKGPQYPVENVNWYDADEFCKKLSQQTGKNVHLPTEAQWEYACRAGTTTPFNTGKTISTDQANYKGEEVYGDGKKGENRGKTTPVDAFKPNAWGLYDMHGNVYQWCADWYGKDYYAKGHNIDPVGPPTGPERTTNGLKILRGGSWFSPPQECRSAYRYPDPQACIIRILDFGWWWTRLPVRQTRNSRPFFVLLLRKSAANDSNQRSTRCCDCR